MKLKNLVSKQYRDKVDRTASRIQGIHSPKEGWIRTVRKALMMTGTQLASRMNSTRARISHLENVEHDGAITLKTMHKIADAMQCRFVYAIVPNESIDDIIVERAKRKAMALIQKTNEHMALEDQSLSEDQLAYEVERLTEELIKANNKKLWDDT